MSLSLCGGYCGSVSLAYDGNRTSITFGGGVGYGGSVSVGPGTPDAQSSVGGVARVGAAFDGASLSGAYAFDTAKGTTISGQVAVGIPGFGPGGIATGAGVNIAPNGTVTTTTTDTGRVSFGAEVSEQGTVTLSFSNAALAQALGEIAQAQVDAGMHGMPIGP
jgi:hypothetical protein